MITSAPARRRPVARRALAAWSIALACLVICVGSLGVWVASGIGLAPDALLYVVLPLSFGGVGALLTTRVPDNAIGPLLLAAIIGFTTLIGGQAWVLLGHELGHPLPGTTVAALAAGLAFIPSIVVVLVGIPLIFPTGRFLSPGWRWVAVAVGIAVVVAEIRPLLGAPFLMEISTLPNPLYRPALEPILTVADRGAALAAVPLFALTAASVLSRYRRGSQVERHQLRWLAAACLIAVVAFSLSFNLPEEARGVAEITGLMAIAAYPLAIGVAIVRYRLYDIDRLISRGIAYSLITVILVAVYAGVVLALQGLLGGIVGEGTVPVAVSTLVVASLFQPVRRRVQRVVDQRFDRARIDAERTSGAFAARLRDEVDIDALSSELTATVTATVRPAGLGLWLRDGGDRA